MPGRQAQIFGATQTTDRMVLKASGGLLEHDARAEGRQDLAPFTAAEVADGSLSGRHRKMRDPTGMTIQ